jgi:hypothetical protein
LRQPITLQRFTQSDTFEQLVSSVEGIIDHDGIMYAGSLCKLDLLDSSIQPLGDRFLGFRSASGETFMERSKARRCDEEVGGFYRCLLDKTDSLDCDIAGVNIDSGVGSENFLFRTCASISRMGRRPVL